MQCAKCGSRQLRRMKRMSWLEVKVYPLRGYFPWECTDCRMRQMMKHRGVKKAPQTSVFQAEQE